MNLEANSGILWKAGGTAHRQRWGGGGRRYFSLDAVGLNSGVSPVRSCSQWKLSWWLGQSSLCILPRVSGSGALAAPLLGAVPGTSLGGGRCWSLLGGLAWSPAQCEPHLTGLNQIIEVYQVSHFVKWFPNLCCKFGNENELQGPWSYSALSVGETWWETGWL